MHNGSVRSRQRIKVWHGGGSSYRRGGLAAPPPAPLPKIWHPPYEQNFKLYMNHCHRDPVNIFFINVHNSLFRLLILFDQLQITLLNLSIWRPLEFSAPPSNSPPPATPNLNPPLVWHESGLGGHRNILWVHT